MSFRIALPLVLTLLPGLAQAQMSDLRCEDSSRLEQTLTQVLGAERHGMGLRDPNTVLEVWVTQQSGDWIVVQTYSNGTSCIEAMGEHWDGTSTGPA